MILWLNGALCESVTARIDPADRGFLLGDGLFETIAVRNGKIIRLDAHLDRLKQGCAVLQLTLPAFDVAQAIAELLAANHLTEAVIRLTLTRGVGQRGVLPPESQHPTFLITAAPLPAPEHKAAHCILAALTCRNERSPLARIKSLNYFDGILARQEAVARKADDAILLNTKGAIAEATSSNVFIVKAGEILTPPVNDGALPGILRGVLIAKGAKEQTLKPADLCAADEMFLTNSLGLRSVISFDSTTIGRSTDYPVTQKLQKQFFL